MDSLLEIFSTLLHYSASNYNCWEMFPSYSSLSEGERRNQCNTMTEWYLSGLPLIFSHWGHPRHSQADRKYNRLLWQTADDFRSIALVRQYVTYSSLSIFYKYTDERCVDFIWILLKLPVPCATPGDFTVEPESNHHNQTISDFSKHWWTYSKAQQK